jgi:hypothetical protein
MLWNVRFNLAVADTAAARCEKVMEPRDGVYAALKR